MFQPYDSHNYPAPFPQQGQPDPRLPVGPETIAPQSFPAAGGFFPYPDGPVAAESAPGNTFEWYGGTSFPDDRQPPRPPQPGGDRIGRLERRVDRLEREQDRLNREVDRIDRRLRVVERRIGIPVPPVPFPGPPPR
jgi:hypothetical protein